MEHPIKDTHSEKGTINISTKDAFNVPKVPPRRGQLPINDVLGALPISN